MTFCASAGVSKTEPNLHLSIAFASDRTLVSKFREVTYTGAAYERGRRWFVSKRPRRDINRGSETEVTETEKRQAKEEREKRKHARTSSDSSKASPRATKELEVFFSARLKRSNPPWMEVK